MPAPSSDTGSRTYLPSLRPLRAARSGLERGRSVGTASREQPIVVGLDQGQRVVKVVARAACQRAQCSQPLPSPESPPQLLEIVDVIADAENPDCDAVFIEHRRCR